MRNIVDILIVSDLDGTFLGKGGRIVQRNVDAIRRFSEKGGLFTFATGRMSANILKNIPMAESLVTAPAILANGGYIYDFEKRQTVYAEYMDSDIVIPIIRFIDEYFPEVTVRLSTESRFWITRFEGGVKDDMERTSEPSLYTVAPIEEWKTGDWTKFVVRGKDSDLDRLRAAILERFGEPLECNKSDASFLEYQKLGCTKASSMLRLKEIYRKEGRDLTVIAVGDYENDLEMLKKADLSICPENAIDSVKAICDYCICHHDEGAIADLIERLEDGRI